MPEIRMRLQHAQTGAEQTLGNEDFVEGEVERLVSIQDRLQTVGELGVTVEVEELLGVGTKPLPAGQHRAVVEVLSGGGWAPVINGTLTNERAAHGRSWGGVRRWALTIVEDAAESVWSRLEGVLLRQAAATLTAGRYDVEWMEATGSGLGAQTRAAWGIDELTALAFAAAGLPAPSAPSAWADILEGVQPTVALCAPRPEGTGNTVPAWTGNQLVELRCEAVQLVLEAAYAAWPSRGVAAVALRRAVVEVPEPGTAEFAALLDLDLDDETGEPWHDEYDWSTEPGDEDGAVLDDVALVYRGGPDGSYIGDDGDVLEVPLQATYAARRSALSGTRAPGRTGDGREVENRQSLELPVLLPAHQASAASGTAYQTLTLDGYDVHVSRPIYEADDGEPDEDAVYLLSLVQAGGVWRSVVERRGPGGLAVCETWARELYPRHAYTYGDAEVVELDVPSEAVPDGAVVLSDAQRGVRFEGLAWIVRALTRRLDSARTVLTLARPAGASSSIEDSTSPVDGRDESDPVITASTSQTTDTDDQGQTSYWVDQVRVEAGVVESAETPNEIQLERDQGFGSWARVSPQQVRQRSVSYSQSSGQGQGESDPQAQPNVFDGEQWRVRVRYPSGTLTDWVTTTAS